jgi:23S rRNA (uracil1939-C5)-methyltransferase
LLLSIEKLIYGGEGLARTPPAADGRSMAIFVPFVLPGEKVEATIQREKPGFARGTADRLIEVSPDRVEARCPYFRRCGGCHYQHIRYEEQLAFKAGILRETLQRIAKINLQTEIRLHASPPWNYRNRTRLQVRTAPEFALGYFRFASHEILSVEECPISSPLLNRVITRLIELRGLQCPTTIEEVELFANAEDEQLLVSAFCSAGADNENLLRWAEFLEREVPEIIGVTFFSSRRRSAREPADDDAPMNPQPLVQSGTRATRYRTRAHEYRVSAGSFFQVNRFLIDEMVSVVTSDVSGDVALDLYAGVGLFSAALAPHFRHVVGVEASLTSHADFVQNVPGSVSAVSRRTEDYLRSDDRRSRPTRGKPDLIVLDPPRAGAGKAVIRSLLDLGAPCVRYVSCDPATLARDVAPLLASGYRVEQAHLFDLFPETFHIESVMLLSR